MAEFHSNNELIEGFVVSVYVLGFAFGPLIVAPLSEMYGRMPIYHICSALYLVFTIICAVSVNMDMLIVFRFLAGSVGAAPLALGGGTIADVIPRYAVHCFPLSHSLVFRAVLTFRLESIEQQQWQFGC
jgi:MFS family permease